MSKVNKQNNILQTNSPRVTIFNYIKLRTRLFFISNKIMSKKQNVIRIILAILVYILFLGLAYLFLRSLLNQTQYITGKSLSIALFTIAQIILLISAIIEQIKRLYKPDDLQIISTFPMTSLHRYIGEIVSIWIKMTIFSFTFMYPLLIIYGISGGMIGNTAGAGGSAAYIFSSLFATILLPLLPLAVSLIVSVPFMFLSGLLQNKNIIKLILFIIVFIGLLVLYGFFLKLMTDLYIHSSTSVEMMEGIKALLEGLNKPYNLCFFISQICLYSNLGINFLIYFSLVILFVVIGVLITKPLYQRFTTTGFGFTRSGTIKGIKITTNNSFISIFTKEVRQIIRTQTYAFFYLSVALSMPILTYLITGVIKSLGEASVGNNAFFGLAMLILLIIISLIGSFSANVISREGDEFYITKIIPISYRKQLIIKGLVNFTVSFIGLLLCIIVLAATSVSTNELTATITPGDLALLFFIATFFLIGITFNGILINLKRPKTKLVNGQPSESNIVIQLLIGLIITSLVSIITIVFDGVLADYAIWLHLGILGLMIIYALITFLLFYFKAEQLYAEIEGKQ